MEALKSKLQWCNGMVLLSGNDTESEEQMLPCKKVLAVTPWKRQRDEILFSFLSSHLLQPCLPVLIFANSIVEVNLLTAFVCAQFPSIDENEIFAIGTNLSISDLFKELASTSSKVRIFVLSAQMALAALVHGILQIQNFSALCFADARGANQNHPFCIIMNHFYTPHSQHSRIRVVGFTEEPKNVEFDMFTKRDWIKTLKHYTHTFKCVPMSLDPQNCAIRNYLESFESLSISPLFDPLSIYETRTKSLIPYTYPTLKELKLPEDDTNSYISDVLVLDHETKIDEIPQLIAFLFELKAQFPLIKKLIHLHEDFQFSAQLSLQVALRNLSSASQAPSNQLDPKISNTLCKDATALFSQSEHLLGLTDDAQERIIRNPTTGSLLIDSTAIPILVRACTLLSRQYRQSSANETIQFKTLRVFPVDSTGQQKLSSNPKHLSLLSLPKFMYEKIKGIIPQPASLEGFHIQGLLVMSRHQAQCCAAFEAVRLLVAAGMLDDNLLLSSEYRKLDDDDDDIIDDNIDEIVDEEAPSDLLDSSLSFNELIPDSLIVKNQQLFVYAIEYELNMQGSSDDPLALDPDPIILCPYSRLLLQSCPSVDFFSVSRSNRTWAIVLPSKLPETFVPIEIPLGAEHLLKTELKLIGEMSRDSLEYEKLLKAQQILFGMFNMKPITVPESSSLETYAPTSIVPDNMLPFYLIAPLTDSPQSRELTDLESIPQVYQLFKKFVECFKGSPLDGASCFVNTQTVSRDWEIDWKLIESDCISGLKLSDYIAALDQISDSSAVQLEEGGVLIDFKRFALERLAFFTPHTRIFYRLNHRFLPDPIYPSSPFSSASFPNATTHAQYVAARYNLTVSPGEMEKEMLAVKRIESWSDLAVWISDDGASKNRRKKSSNSNSSKSSNNSKGSSPSASLIIPEFTRIFPASYATFRISMLIPRVTFEIERQLRISQFFSDRLPPSLPKPTHARQVEALTASTSSLSYSYEQLEVLGDSFLKYYSTLDTLLVGAGWSEGRLSSHRQRILCNANLRRAAEELQITTYASFTPFFSKLWSPPPLIPHIPPATTSLDSTVNRVLFAPEERWRLLAEVEGKQTRKQVVYQIDPNGILSVFENYKTKEQTKNSTDSLFKYGQLIPPKSLADILEALIGIYYVDCGVQGALSFLIHCKILRPEIVGIRRMDPLRLLIGSEALESSEQAEKLKRRKLTPMNQIVLDQLDQNQSGGDLVELTLVRETQSIEISIGQKVHNVLPYAPPFSQFPFDALESSLGHVFKYRELLFMACTHSSVDAKLNNERLEWIGDAAIDWLVGRHYWYNYRLDCKGIRIAPILTRGTNYENPDFELSHSSHPHIPIGYLPLSPESLTNSRQSAINNDTFARLLLRLGLHRFLRINSPHLQIEIERFGNEFQDPKVDSKVADPLPLSLNQLHTHVSVAAPKVLGDLFESLMGSILLDSHFDIDGKFNDSFIPCLKSICSDPSDLPTNAIQETLHLYARLGIPRHQIVYTFKEISRDACLGVNCQVWVRERCVAEAEGSNKAVAKKMAMERALDELTNNPSSYTL